MIQTTDFFLECPKLVLEVLYTKGDGGYDAEGRFQLCIAGALVMMLCYCEHSNCTRYVERVYELPLRWRGARTCHCAPLSSTCASHPLLPCLPIGPPPHSHSHSFFSPTRQTLRPSPCKNRSQRAGIGPPPPSLPPFTQVQGRICSWA
jgi:hypothetical protein